MSKKWWVFIANDKNVFLSLLKLADFFLNPTKENWLGIQFHFLKERKKFVGFGFFGFVFGWGFFL